MAHPPHICTHARTFKASTVFSVGHTVRDSASEYIALDIEQGFGVRCSQAKGGGGGV